ncbi:Probable serine/threonine-protein kinase At1g09600 [Linum perenne]
MGCIASKESSSPREMLSSRRGASFDRRVAHVNTLGREEGSRSRSVSENGDVKVMLIEKRNHGSSRHYSGQLTDVRAKDYRIEKKTSVERREIVGDAVPAAPVTATTYSRSERRSEITDFSDPAWGRVPKSLEAEQVAAGWPAWFVSVAGESIKGWVPRKANTFEKLDRIGQGTYSSVYKARDVTHNKIVALKKVRFDSSDPDSVKFMAREILILRKLDHPNVIKLEGLITSQTSSTLYLVFEYMEHDLTGLASIPGLKFTEPQIKCYMKQLLSGLDHCHSRGVLHRDIKGSNLLIDDSGVLKIADFGLASFFDPKSGAALTSRVVTLWYRAPELLLGACNYGVSVDLWSTGCILGELYSGKPILPGRTEVEQLHKIFKLCGSPSEDYWKNSKLPHSSVIKPQRPYKRCVGETFKDFPAPALGLLETLLSIDPAQRGNTALVLESEYFTTRPFACDPSSLPKYPPSKEIDAKKRDEEARRQRDRQREVAAKGNDPNESMRKGLTGNVDLSTAQISRHSYSKGDMSHSSKDKNFSGLLVHPSKQIQASKEGRRSYMENQRPKVSHSGPLVHGGGWTKSGRDHENTHGASTRSNNLSGIAGLVASRPSLPDDYQGKPSTSQPDSAKQVNGRLHGSLSRSESPRVEDRIFPRQGVTVTDSSQARSGQLGGRDPGPYIRGSKGNKIYVSGPLLVPSNNVEQMLKDHDRQIQEFARRRVDKSNLAKAGVPAR